jgi:hypothetical protein
VRCGQPIIRETLATFKRNNKQFLPSLGLSTAGMDGVTQGSKLVGQKVSRESTLTRRFFK